MFVFTHPKYTHPMTKDQKSKQLLQNSFYKACSISSAHLSHRMNETLNHPMTENQN